MTQYASYPPATLSKINKTLRDASTTLAAKLKREAEKKRKEAQK
jgi:hypothetical protein